MPEEWRSLEPAVRNGLSECRVRRGCEVESMVCVPGSGRGESVGRNFRPSFDRPSFAPERVGRCLATLVARCTSVLLSCGAPLKYPTAQLASLNIRLVSSVDAFVIVFVFSVFFVPCIFDPQPLA